MLGFDAISELPLSTLPVPTNGLNTDGERRLEVNDGVRRLEVTSGELRLEVEG